MSAYEIIMVVVVIPAGIWILKTVHDVSKNMAVVKDRMDGIQSFARALLEMQADIKNIYRIVERRKTSRPVANDRRCG